MKKQNIYICLLLGLILIYTSFIKADSQSTVKIGNQTWTTKNLNVFGDAIYLGTKSFNNQPYFCVLILPETLFNINQPLPVPNVSIFSTSTSLFYVMSNTNGTQFTNKDGSILKVVITTSNNALITSS